MQWFQILSLILLWGMGLCPLALAQEAPPGKPTADPFGDGKTADDARKKPASHQIEMDRALEEGKTLEERLEELASFQADGATLKSFTETLERALDFPVVLANKKLEEAAVNSETPMSYRLGRNVRVRTALRLILGDLGLTYVIHDNVLVITTPEDASSQLVTRVYDCRDLIKLPSPIKKAPPPNNASVAGQPDSEVEPPKAVPEQPSANGGYEMEHLMNLIITTVDPDSWDEVGGPGSIAEFKGLLTLSTTQETHEKVERLLNMLHQAGGLEEKVKVSR